MRNHTVYVQSSGTRSRNVQIGERACQNNKFKYKNSVELMTIFSTVVTDLLSRSNILI